jgi:hypothetical protein
VLDGSALKADSNAQDIDVADLGSALRLRRSLVPVLPAAPGHHDGNADSDGDGDGDDDESAANVLDGSAAGINQNAQNLSIAELKRRQEPLPGLSGEGEDVDDVVDDVVDEAAAVQPFRRDGGDHDGDGDDDDELANVLDGSEAAVDDNLQDITVLRRRAVPTPSASATAVPSAAAAPAAVATPTPSSAPAAASPVSSEPAAAGDNDHDHDNDDDDSVLNAADGSGADISKNLQNITVLRRGDEDSDGDNDESVANVLDGSALQADKNVQNVDVAELR